MKCKVFRQEPQNVEQEINDWLVKEKPIVKIVTSNTAMPTGAAELIVTVFYE